MTAAQAQWLSDNPDFAVVGHRGAVEAMRGTPAPGNLMLYPNGECHPWRPLGVPGAFAVGPRKRS
jgi:hypothetical protein